ncbi:high-potential iron-sulfur protein [Paraburkholderia bannensis]|uniref:high-potential iron-sulfur protein n=1 Tax=Paraburkholderia bannensis TaxID=765414 RepID=UPI002AB785AD|nr:high-potential iron-sulfur protein [Paraburkholderia bannensis]
MNTSRRKFLVLSLCSASSLALTGEAFADEPALAESDEQARRLGYKADATTVDPKQFPSYKAGQACSGCSLFQAGSDDKWGDCLLFSGKRVAAAGWCTSFSTM